MANTLTCHSLVSLDILTTEHFQARRSALIPPVRQVISFPNGGVYEYFFQGDSTRPSDSESVCNARPP